MLRFVQVFMVYFSSYFGTSCSSGISNRIVGGHAVNISDFPYQLALEKIEGNEYVSACGASVLSIEWALTAGHCVYGVPKQNMRLRGATSYLLSAGRVHRIGRVVLHSSYNDSTLNYDIAVLKVARKKFEFTERLQPIRLAHTVPSAGSPCVVSGWGQLHQGGPQSFPLQAVRVRIIDRNTCQRFFRRHRVTSRELCAGIPEETKGPCGRDSGGPLVANGEQIGITSWTVRCGSDPGVFVSVPVFRQWITSKTGVN